MQRILGVAVIAIGVLAAIGHAGGPLRFTYLKPLVWDTTQPISYWIDRGPMKSPQPPNDPGVPDLIAQQMVQDAFKVWSDIATATLRFRLDGILQTDIDSGLEFLEIAENDSRNIVIFDQDGQILNDLFGLFQSESILGFAAPLVNDQETAITRFVSLMNGKLVDSNAPQGFFSTLVHEFGHAMGLDHSQIHEELANDGVISNDEQVPMMYPTSTDTDDAGLTRPLHPDDIAWASYLYPSGTFSQSFGKIHGKIFTKGTNGDPFLGVNVVATSLTDPDAPQFSCVSDYLKSRSGDFVIPVPPGTYQLSVVEIRAGFHEGSSVGPWAESKTDLSFTHRPRLTTHPSPISVAPNNCSMVLLEVERQP